MTTAPALAPGARVADRFDLLESLGADGLGAAFHALDTASDCKVVLRVFPAGVLPAADRQHLRADAEAAARVSHPNVAAPLASGSDEAAGVDWVAEERARGETLATLLATRGTPPRPLALRLLHELVAGVAAAHRSGVLHGDLHPGNVFLARMEEERRVRVRVTGLGQRRGRAAPRTGMPAAPRYAAPERLRREPALTPAADVFALGVMAYELLAGLPPQWNQVLTAMVRGQAASLPSPVEMRPDLLPALAEVVLGALEADPLRRYPDAGALGAALDRVMAAEAAPPAAVRSPVAASAAASQPSAAPTAPAPVRATPSTPPPAAPAPATPSTALPSAPAAPRKVAAVPIAPRAAAELGDALYIPPTIAPRPEAPRPAPQAPPVVAAPPESVTPTAAATTPAPPAVPAPVDAPRGEERMAASPAAAPSVAVAVEPVPAPAVRKPRIVPSADRGGRSPFLLAGGAAVALLLAGGLWTFALAPRDATLAPAPAMQKLSASSAAGAPAPSAAEPAATLASAAQPVPAAARPAAAAAPTRPQPAAEAPAKPKPAPAAATPPPPVARAATATPQSAPAQAPPAAAPVPPVQQAAPPAPRAEVERPAPVATAPAVPAAGRVYRLDEVERRPSLANQPEVRRALARNVPPSVTARGTVTATVRFVVREDGRIDLSTLSVVDASQANLGATASRVLSRARFEPGRVNGQPVKTEVVMPIAWEPE